MAQDTAVGTGNGLLALRDAGTFAWACWADTLQLLLALAALGHIAALLHVLVHETATGRANTGM